MQSLIQRHRVLLIHLLFWCVYSSFFFYQIIYARTKEEPDWARIFKDLSTHIVCMMIISYLNYFIFLPRFLKHRNLGRYILEFSIPFALSMYGLWSLKKMIVNGCTFSTPWIYTQKFVVNLTLSSLLIVLFVGMLKFVEEWFELEARKKEIENERLTSELRFLKAQINPHFLFNTLNNLYYLAFTQSPNTTEVIAKLSQMMRYMMYDSNHPRVPLSKEIEYMENYISLEKLRLNNEVPILFEVRGNTDGVLIAPLIFITFLENAFKHGVSNSAKNTWVKASIEISGKACVYIVENSKMVETDKTVTEKSGIGLSNVKRRLDLSYPDNYELTVQDFSDRYIVELKMNLI
ncbi:MAG: histidine kinase [Saprospiraceae bacterium]|nr:histidine kinase [Saprospiraceae bacterium]